jgi:hypothetical protein
MNQEVMNRRKYLIATLSAASAVAMVPAMAAAAAPQAVGTPSATSIDERKT